MELETDYRSVSASYSSSIYPKDIMSENKTIFSFIVLDKTWKKEKKNDGASIMTVFTQTLMSREGPWQTNLLLQDDLIASGSNLIVIVKTILEELGNICVSERDLYPAYCLHPVISFPRIVGLYPWKYHNTTIEKDPWQIKRTLSKANFTNSVSL